MRRIIERVVTVVTTTTWKISWEDDPLRPTATTDPVSEELSALEMLPEATPPGTGNSEIKEADPPAEKIKKQFD